MYRISAIQLKKIQLHLKKGGVIAYPTESCYGFGCDPFNIKAIQKIINIKHRSSAKGLIVIAGKISELNHLIQPISTNDKQELSQYWPGPYSIILPTTSHTPKMLTGTHNSLAVRITKHQQVRTITRHLNYAIVSTSANKSGKQSIKTYRECVQQFGSLVMVIKGLTSFAKKPSTIINWQTKQVVR